MNQLNTAPTLTHDEIALHAFLIWEKDGRQAGREQTYWLQAEAHLHQTWQQKAESAAKAARTWPPQTAAAPKLSTARAITPAAPKAAVPKTTKLAAASRNVAVKPASVAKPAARKSASAAPARKSLARN